MSRSGYVDDCDDPLAVGRWRAQVNNAMRGKRGQEFLKELLDAMDAMTDRVLIAEELVSDEGECCTIGVVCKSRGLDVSDVDYDCPEEVGAAVDIARQMAAEIEYQNDECGDRFELDGKDWVRVHETPEERWTRMRAWVESKIIKDE